MHKPFISIAALSGAIAVGLGAFGAHGLKKILQPQDLATFQTGVQYQMYHTLALLAAAIVYGTFQNKWLKWSGLCFIIGMILFSGSLYVITFLKNRSSVGLEGIGLITPVGGLFFIIGWVFLLIGVINRRIS